MTFQHPVDRWEPWDPHMELTDGPIRIYDDDPKPDLARRPVGFVPVAAEIEPLVWEGDDS